MERYDKQKSRELRGRIRIVLMEEWDPIGVKDIPEAADECDTYIGSIHGLLVRKAPITEISEYLNWVEVGQMGLGRSTEAARVVLDTVAAS